MHSELQERLHVSVKFWPSAGVMAESVPMGRRGVYRKVLFWLVRQATVLCAPLPLLASCSRAASDPYSNPAPWTLHPEPCTLPQLLTFGLSLQESWQGQGLWADAGCIENFDSSSAHDQKDGRQQKQNNVHPTPHTLHPTSYTLHPKPYTPYLSHSLSTNRCTCSWWCSSSSRAATGPSAARVSDTSLPCRRTGDIRIVKYIR